MPDGDYAGFVEKVAGPQPAGRDRRHRGPGARARTTASTASPWASARASTSEAVRRATSSASSPRPTASSWARPTGPARDSFGLLQPHWVDGPPPPEQTVEVRIRHRHAGAPPARGDLSARAGLREARGARARGDAGAGRGGLRSGSRARRRLDLDRAGGAYAAALRSSLDRGAPPGGWLQEGATQARRGAVRRGRPGAAPRRRGEAAHRCGLRTCARMSTSSPPVPRSSSTSVAACASSIAATSSTWARRMRPGCWVNIPTR